MSRLDRTLRAVPGASHAASVPGVRDLGAYLREQRQNAQLSVRQLSKVAGISNPYLSQIERGLRRPSADILQALAKGLEISAESLYVQAGFLEGPVDQAAGGEDVDGVDARAALRSDPRLTPRQRQLLIDLYDSFVDPGEPAAGPTTATDPGALTATSATKKSATSTSPTSTSPTSTSAAATTAPAADADPARPRPRRSRRPASTESGQR